MLTPDEREQLTTLRELQKKASDAYVVFDRFMRPEDEARYKAFDSQAAALPENVRQYAAREDELKKFVSAIESYILERSSRFLPDVDNLTTTIMNLPLAGDLTKSQLSELKGQAMGDAIHNLKGMNKPLRDELPVHDSLAKLLTLKATNEEIEIAILLAADLDESRLQKVKYLTRLKNLVAEYLDARLALLESQQPKGLASLWTKTPEPLPESEDLVHATREWQALIPQYREQIADLEASWNSKDPLQRVDYRRFQLMRQIAILHRLATQDETIDSTLFEAQNAWNGKQGKKLI